MPFPIGGNRKGGKIIFRNGKWGKIIFRNRKGGEPMSELEVFFQIQNVFY